MIGIVVVTHGKIGQEMVEVASSIVRDSHPLFAISAQHDEDLEVLRRKVRETVEKADQGEGVLLLSDLFGGTPSNICLSFLQEKKIEVVTGVNLPMLIKLASFQGNQSLAEIADFIKNYGQKNISRAAEVLQSR